MSSGGRGAAGVITVLGTIRREVNGARCRETFVELTALLSSSSRGAKTG